MRVFLLLVFILTGCYPAYLNVETAERNGEPLGHSVFWRSDNADCPTMTGRDLYDADGKFIATEVHKGNSLACQMLEGVGAAAAGAGGYIGGQAVRRPSDFDETNIFEQNQEQEINRRRKYGGED